MSNKNMANTFTVADSGVNTNQTQEERKKEKDYSSLVFPVFLLWSLFQISVAMYYDKGGSLGALYFGMVVLLVIVLLYVVPGIGCVISGYRIRKQIISKHGSMDYGILKRDLKENKYYSFFKGVNICLLVIVFGTGFMAYSIAFILGKEAFISGLFEVPSLTCYFVSDFFTMDTKMVTYVGESKYIYPEIAGRREETTHIDIYSYRIACFRTSSGELLSLIVDKDNLAEIRIYNNTEIKYIPHISIHVP